jgi:glycosyltransferase involved in cell wall biosynthesis
MKIAYIAVKGIPIGGGIEKLTEEIGTRMVPRGHAVTVYSSRDYGSTDGRFNGMEIRTVPSMNTKTLHKLSICFNATRDALKRREADIVHVHAVGPSLFSIFPRLAGIPTVVQTHGLEWKRDKWGFVGQSFFKLADYTAVYFPDRTTSVSRVQKSYYEKKFKRKIDYIPTGVNNVEQALPDWILEQGLEPGRYILFAARLVEEKGAHFLIDAFRGLHTEMKLVVAGDAAHSDAYKTRLREKAGDDPRILFPGFVTGKPLAELFSNAYVFCLPSTIEGLPIALLEAMSYGNCCLASDIPENMEAVEKFGYYFRNRDVESLREALSVLIRQPDRVEGIRRAAREHVLTHYSWDSVTDRMERLYREILENHRNGRTRKK